MAKNKTVEIQEENELATWAERNLAEIKPYWQQIALAIALGFLIFVGITYWLEGKKNLEAAKWQDLSTAIWNAESTKDVADLTFLAQEYPDHPVGMWALQLAGDFELRTGIQKFTTDRKTGMDKVKKAQTYFQQVVDSGVKKTPMLQRRSVFGLAYSAETAGDFETAKVQYQKVIDEGDGFPFFEAATRGLERSSNIDYVAFFDKFRSWEVASAEEAPAQVLPDRPNLDFPDLGNMTPDSGGEFTQKKTETAEAPAPAAAAKLPAVEMPKATSDVVAPELPAMETAPGSESAVPATVGGGEVGVPNVGSKLKEAVKEAGSALKEAGAAEKGGN